MKPRPIDRPVLGDRSSAAFGLRRSRGRWFARLIVPLMLLGGTPLVGPAPAQAQPAEAPPAGAPSPGPAATPAPPPATAPTTAPPADPPAEPERPPVTDAELEQARSAINAAVEGGTMDGAEAEAALRLLEQVRERVARRRELEQRRDDFQRLIAEAPATLEANRSQLAQPPARPTPQVPERASLAQLEQRSNEVEAELEVARRAVPELSAEARRRAERTTAIATELATVRARIAELQTAISGPPPDLESAPRAYAQRLLDVAALQARLVERAALQAEASSYEARAELLPARRALAERRVQELETLAGAWRTVVSARVAEEAREAEEAAREAAEAARSHPVLQAFAEETQQLAALRTGEERLTLRAELARQRADDRLARLSLLARQFSAIKERLDASGLNRATGVLLRREFETLPDAADLRRRVRAISETAEEIALQRIEWEDRLLAAGDTGQTASELVAAIAASGEIDEQQLDEFRQVALELAIARANVLQSLSTDAIAFSNALVTLEINTRGLAQAAEAFESFIRERILWIRSIPANRPITLADFEAATDWVVDPDAWGDTAVATGKAALARWAQVALWLILLGGLFAAIPRLRARVKRRGKEVASYRTDSFARSFEVLGLSLLLALPVPLILIAVGWLLARPTDQTSLGIALGAGLRTTGLLLLPYTFLLQVLRPLGLADAHFRWSSTAVKAARRHLRWFVTFATPVTIITVAINAHADEAIQATVGRACFTAVMVLIAILAERLLRPSGPVLADWLRRHDEAWIRRLQWIWYPLLIILPIAFAAAAWSGWYYTALELQDRLQRTFVLLVALVVANGFLLRWLFIARRQVAIDEARRRREQAIADAKKRAKAAAGEGETPKETTTPAINEDTLDLPSISAQTRQLFRTAIGLTLVAGFYLIWVDVAPALRILDRIEVYPRLAIVEAASDASIPVLEDAEAAIAAAATGDGASGRTVNGSSRASGAGANGSAGGGATGAADGGGNGAGGGTPLIPGMPAANGGGSGSGNETAAEEAPISVTLADIGLSLLAAILTLVAVRNLPGLVEIAILQRLPVDAAARYALSTVLRYVIVIVGLIIVAGSVGVTWSKLQWLAAALTFGLAFGLQEIFANFISGLIILAERPVRVGDTVTVGNTSGVVTRIRMRATTITDWDRKELIIPNKTFITSDVINWTLSDPVLRVMIPVGVGYGEDVDRARSLLLEVARKHEIVLSDPAPQALFLGFGDSTLNFEMRVFIPKIDHLLVVKNDMHFGILKAFREAGIEIAFPQRDLHVRSIGDLAQFVTRREDLPASELAGERS